MFSINNKDRELLFNDEVLYKFVAESDLQNTKYTLYAYAEMVDDDLFIKFGEAKKQSIFSRYNSTGHMANIHMVRIWESEKGDKEIHSKLKVRSKNNRGYSHVQKDDSLMNTEESYLVESKQGLENLLADITEYAASKTEVIKQVRTDYDDVTNLVDEVISTNQTYYVLDLCTRFGKTGTFNLLFRKYAEQQIRFNILASYVGTVKTSYSEEINTIKNNENCLFIDPDNYAETKEIVKVIKAWLQNPDHYICYYLALTGDEDTCYERRIAAVTSKAFAVYDKTLVVEEADFGAGCDKQIRKIKKLFDTPKYNFKHLIATTGTKAEKCERICQPDVLIKRDYLVDVLNKRPNAVGINWYILNNSEMVKVFNYQEAEMENFNDMFTIENNKLKGDIWFRDVFNFLYNYELPEINKDTRKYRKHDLINPAASMVFTINSKEAQQKLKTLIEDVVGPSYLVKVINGDITTNADAEAEARQTIKDWGTKVIFIASAMANRSFSVPEIKNVILLCNSGFPDQKIARGFTPWKEHDMKCNIIDFRLAYEQTSLSNYLSNLAVDSLADNATHNSIKRLIEEIEATDKLTFFEYFTAGSEPIRELTSDEIKIQMHSASYLTAKALKIVFRDLVNIDNPADEFNDISEKFKFNDLTSTNLKGDSGKKVTVTRAVNNNSKTEDTTDQRLNYLAYLLNHKDEFNSGKYETNILENEFHNNMPAKRKKAIEKLFHIDMNVMSQIAELLIKNEVKIYN